MTQAQSAMDETIEQWLTSRKGFERYMAATERLYVAFAQTWQGSRRTLAEAFTDFQAAVLKEHEFKHLEVVTVFPERRLESK